MKLQSDLSKYEQLPPIHINARGNLVIRAWEQHTIEAQTSDEDPTLLLDETQVLIETNDDLIVNLPMGSDLVLEAGGDAHIQHTSSNLQISHIGGNLNIEKAGAVEIDDVGGDMHLRDVETLTCRKVGGNAVVHGVSGNVAVSARGDLHVMGCGGDVAGDARGNAQVEVLAATPNVRVNAGGDIQCRLQEGVSARVRAVSGGDLHVSGADGHLSAQGRGVHAFNVGSGDGSIALVAAGNVNIVGAGRLGDLKSVTEDSSHFSPGADFGKEMEKLGVELDRFGQEMAALGTDLGQEFGSLGEKIAEKINRKLRHKLERNLRRASAKAGRKAGAGAQAWSFGFEAPTPPRPPRPPRPSAPDAGSQQEPVSDQERMMVLRMVEEGKITASEAEKLLAALEGEYPES